MPSPPRLFHLLGRWQDSRLIFDALPNRPDLFKTKGGVEGESYFLINQIEHCDAAGHDHFPRAEMGIFPGAELRHNRGPPEPDFYNWQPWTAEHRLLNWNLEEDMPAYADGGEPAPMRYRRQAPPPASGGAALRGRENRVGLTVQKGSRKWTFKKQYSAFAATMVNSTLAKKNVPQVREYFQDIWKPADSWNWEMVPATAAAAAAGPFITKITVPPFCQIFFNDASVLQALGFDLVGVRDNANSLQVKLSRDGGPPTYFFENTENVSKTFASARPVANLPIYKLRALAKRERARLAQELRFTSPMIDNENDELDTVWEITYVCQPPEALTFELDIEPESSDPARRLDPILNFFRTVFWFLSQHAGLDYDAFEFEAASSDVHGLKLTFNRPSLSSTLDRFSVEIGLGPESLKRMPRMRNSPQINWNLGRTGSVVLPVLSAPLTAAERAEIKRQMVEAERAKAVGFQPPEEAGVVVLQGGQAGPSAANVVVLEEEAAVFDPFAGRLPEEAEIEAPAVQVQEIAPEEEVVRVLEPVKKEVVTPPPTQTTAPKIPTPPTTKKKFVPRVPTPPPPTLQPPVQRAPTPPPVVVQRAPTPPPVQRAPTPPPVVVQRAPTPPPVQRAPTPPRLEVVQIEEEPEVRPVDVAPQQPVLHQPIAEEIEVQPVDLPPPPEAAEPAGGGRGGEEDEEDEEEEEEEEEEAEPPPPPIFQRERMRFLVGNAPRKRRWERDENLAADLPDGYLLVLENAEREDDFMTDYGRCCIAATVLNNRVVTKNKCFVDWQSLQQLTFQVFDSKHLSLVRSFDAQLVKIELLVFH